MVKNKVVEIIELGRMSYKDCWDYQQSLLDSIVEVKIRNRNTSDKISTSNYLIWVEHSPVYTIGNRGNLDHLLLDKGQLKSRGIEFFKTNRGGDITYHGPGQIVCYPILDLDNFFTDLNRYLRLIEQVIIDILAFYGIIAVRSKGETGVWIGGPLPRKICAIGIRTSRWVTMHGFALNVNTELHYFDHIIPCGITNKGVTSIERELGATVNMTEVKEKLKMTLSQHFGILWKES